MQPTEVCTRHNLHVKKRPFKPVAKKQDLYVSAVHYLNFRRESGRFALLNFISNCPAHETFLGLESELIAE